MKEKKEKKRWGLMVFIIFIMIGTSFSVIFFGFAPPGRNTIKYNGISFVSNQNFWTAKINGAEAAFTYLPMDVQEINLSPDIQQKLQNKFELDTTSEANSSFKESIALAQHEMGLTLSAYNIYLRKGFTANNTFKLPVIACKDATEAVPVIYFRQGNATRIASEGSCIIAEASTNPDFIRMKDRLLYSILGVLK